ncbi:hypothetical protein QEN19_003747 [Hanseniaspora menglaensis]
MSFIKLSFFVIIFTLLSVVSEQSKPFVHQLDLSDPDKLNTFKIRFIDHDINELDYDFNEKLFKNFSLISENYTVNDFYDGCLIYQENNHILSETFKDSISFEHILNDSLNHGLEIIKNTTDITPFKEFIPENVADNFLIYLDETQGFVKLKTLSESKWYKFLNYKGPFCQYGLTQGVNIFQYIDSLSPFLLGSAKSDDILKDPTADIKFHSEGYYISLTYDDGSICDATNLPREVELQYVCDTNFDNNNHFANKKLSSTNYQGTSRIIWVKEPYICKYQVLIGVPGLCDVDLLKSNFYSFQNSNYGNFEVICKRKANLINTKGSSFDKIYNWDYKEIAIGREFIYMKSESAANNDYLIFTNIVSKMDDLDLKILTKNFRTVFKSYVQPYLATAPTDLKTFNSTNPIICNYAYAIEVYDLNGNFFVTFEINLGDYGIKVSNKKLQNDFKLLNKNYIKKEISEEIEKNEAEYMKNKLQLNAENDTHIEDSHLNSLPKELIDNLGFNPIDFGIDSELAKSILEKMLSNLEQQDNY